MKKTGRIGDCFDLAGNFLFIVKYTDLFRRRTIANHPVNLNVRAAKKMHIIIGYPRLAPTVPLVITFDNGSIRQLADSLHYSEDSRFILNQEKYLIIRR